MNKTTTIKVLNRDNGSIVYSIPEMNGLRREFQAGETKEVTFEELQKLAYIPGGSEILRENLMILNNPEAVKELVGHVEPEYNYSREDIIKLLKDGSQDEFLDCLDFAPEGVKELIKTLAVELPLNDVAKREAILNKLGFNVDTAIKIRKDAEIADAGVETSKATRRVQKTESESTTPTRRIVKKTE